MHWAPRLPHADVRSEYRRFIKDAYPEVASLRVNVRHHGDLGRSPSDLRAYTRSSLPRVLVCLNPRCTEGGYDLTATLDEAIGARAATRRAALECAGNDGVPRGRGSGRRCGNSVEVELEIGYVPESEVPTPTEPRAAASGEPSARLAKRS